MVRVAINGFGRIGRNILRAAIEAKRSDIEFVAINDLGPPAYNAHLLKYDSVHGTFGSEITSSDKEITVDGRSIKIFSERDPSALPWAELDIDIALECTGIFTKRAQAQAHLTAGAKKVLISAPSPDPDIMAVFGVNHHDIKPEHAVISNASCTTGCLAPVAMVLHENFGIEKGLMTTTHSYTGDQPVLDRMHTDLYRARAAALSMIPTSTGAAKAVGKVLPELDGKLDGFSIRVPTPNVSMIDLKAVMSRDVTANEVNAALSEAAGSKLSGIIEVNDLPLVSSDFNHNPASAIFMTNQTTVMQGNLVGVIAWYDNEWGFSNRMCDMADYIWTNCR